MDTNVIQIMGSSTQPVGSSGAQVVDKLTENISRQLLPERPKKRIISAPTGGVGDQFALLRPSKSETRLKPKFFSIFWTNKPTSQAEEGSIQAPEIPKDPVTVFQEEVKKHVKDVLYTAFWENKIPCSSEELASLEKEIIFQVETNPQYLSDLWVSPNDWWEIYLKLGDDQKRTVLKLGLETEFDFCAFIGPVEAGRKNLNEAQLEQIYNDVRKGDPETQAAFFSDVLPSMDVEAGAEVVLKMVKERLGVSDYIHQRTVADFLSQSPHFYEIYQLSLLYGNPEDALRHTELLKAYSHSLVEDAARLVAFKNNKQVSEKSCYDPKNLVQLVLSQSDKSWEEKWKGFVNDPAFKYTSLIRPEWMKEFFPEDFCTRFEAQAVMLVARYLYACEMPVTQDTVRSAWLDILAKKEECANIPLFEGRHVIIVANNELKEDGKYKFGTSSLENKIKQKGGSSVETIRLPQGDYSDFSNEVLKKYVMQKLIEAPFPLTIMTDVHGDEGGGIWLNHEIFLTQEDLYFIFRQRYERAQNENIPAKDIQDIFITSACYNFNINQGIAESLAMMQIPAPYFAGPGESGETDPFNFDSPYHSDYFSLILRKEKPVLGDLMKLDYNRFLKTNPSVFVPNSKGPGYRPIQIAENKKEKSFSKPV